MAARCSKCQAPGREHAKFSCPPRPGARARAKAAFRANGTDLSSNIDENPDVPQRGAPVAGTGKPAASSDQTKKKKEDSAAA